MRRLAVCFLLTGCLRARATVVHPTDHERSSSGTGGSTIARIDPAVDEVPTPAGAPANLGSFELGAVVPFELPHASVHLSPGVRIFNSHPDAVLFGVAVGADFLGERRGPGLALEGSVHAGNSSADRSVIVQAVDVFAGVTMNRRAPVTWAVGPSVGMLGMPGGASVVTVGLGLRVTSKQ